MQSLKAEIDKLKEKVGKVLVELKNLKGNHVGGHVASTSDPDTSKSLAFLLKEYHDLIKFMD